jgi:hypothetical protein
MTTASGCALSSHQEARVISYEEKMYELSAELYEHFVEAAIGNSGEVLSLGG